MKKAQNTLLIGLLLVFMISFLAYEKEIIETNPNTDQTETTQVETKQSDPFPW
ncbi:MAG: hypothetical protein U9N51_08865 [Bacteroidota bacterium]|nr:hypothetical protein [Bacteroidota bacterium]